MSQSQVFAPRDTDTTSRHDAGAVLDALNDDDCRRILEATTDDSHTASELSETLDLPLSTTYRKLDRLTEVSLLRETIRIHRSGMHVNEYTRNVEDVAITVQDDGTLDVSVTHTVATTERFRHPSHHV